MKQNLMRKFIVAVMAMAATQVAVAESWRIHHDAKMGAHFASINEAMASENVQDGDMLYLEDLEQDTIVAMQQDMPYTFTATALSINDYRFRLLLSPKGGNNSPTDTEDINNISIWMDNNVLHITGTPTNSILQIYNVSGAHILTQAISDTPYIYNLSHLSAGVYLIRINNYTYKVITK